MDVNYIPGRIRLRDKMFRDDEIRNTALAIANGINADQEIVWNEKTSSILVTYNASKVDEEKFKSLSPIIEKYKMKLLVYSERNKASILNMLAEIKSALTEV